MNIVVSVRDPKLIILDPDPDAQNESQEFPIQILLSLDMVKIKNTILVIMKTKWVEIFNFINFAGIVYEIMMNLFTF